MAGQGAGYPPALAFSYISRERCPKTPKEKVMPSAKEHKVTRIKVDWKHPTEILFGVNRISEIAEVCWRLGICAPLLVTDKGVARRDFVRRIIAFNADASIETAVFSEISGEPDADTVSKGALLFRKKGYDGIIAIGGGSALDAGKAIGLTAAVGPMNLWKYDANEKVLPQPGRPIPPIIALPTTAGTGSEVGANAVITDPSGTRKVSLHHPQILPRVVIADPGLTRGLIPYLTASTGMDALSHSLEALCSPVFQPMLDGIALQGIRFIKDWLPIAAAHEKNLGARVYTMAASIMGAMAFEKGLGAMHAIAHAAGGAFKIHHGRVIGAVMPYVLVANHRAVKNKMEHLARILDLPHHNFQSVLEWLIELRYTLGIPPSLGALGIKTKHIPFLADHALRDINMTTNPVAMDKDRLERLLRRAVSGRL